MSTLELEDQTAAVTERCIRIITTRVAKHHEREGDPDLDMVIADDLEILDLSLLVALADALNGLDGFDYRGVKTKGWFSTTITFQTRADAEAAMLKLSDAGYVVEMLDERDVLSDACWLTISKFAGDVSLNDMMKPAAALADALHGDADAHWIAD